MVAPQKPSMFLYNPEFIKDLDWNSVADRVSPKFARDPKFAIRPLKIDDFNKGYVTLLSQLTTTGDVTKTQFEKQFLAMQKAGGYYVTVIEDVQKGEIIGAATLITELKFIHNCGLRGRLEDVVVNKQYRGFQLGKVIVLTVQLLSKQLGCYKMSLDCKDNLIPFYESLGYKCEPGNSTTMVIRHDSNPSSF